MNRRYTTREVYKSPEFKALCDRFGIELDGTKDIHLHLPMNGMFAVTRYYHVVNKTGQLDITEPIVLQLATEEPDDV